MNDSNPYCLYDLQPSASYTGQRAFHLRLLSSITLFNAVHIMHLHTIQSPLARTAEKISIHRLQYFHSFIHLNIITLAAPVSWVDTPSVWLYFLSSISYYIMPGTTHTFFLPQSQLTTSQFFLNPMVIHTEQNCIKQYQLSTHFSHSPVYTLCTAYCYSLPVAERLLK